MRGGRREEAGQEIGADRLSKSFKIFPENVSLFQLGGVYFRKRKNKMSPLTVIYHHAPI